MGSEEVLHQEGGGTLELSREVGDAPFPVFKARWDGARSNLQVECVQPPLGLELDDLQAPFQSIPSHNQIKGDHHHLT